MYKTRTTEFFSVADRNHLDERKNALKSQNIAIQRKSQKRKRVVRSRMTAEVAAVNVAAAENLSVSIDTVPRRQAINESDVIINEGDETIFFLDIVDYRLCKKC